MKDRIYSQRSQFTPRTVAGKHSKVGIAAWIRLLVLLGAILLVASPVRANLLADGDFNAPLGTTWITWTYGGGWANWQNDASSFDGTYYMALGGASGSWYTSGGGVYQVTLGNPGVPYTLLG